jgi:hypothetical protein
VYAVIADKDSLGLTPGKQYTLSVRVASGTIDAWGGYDPTLSVSYYPKGSTKTKRWLTVSFTEGMASVTGICPEDFESVYCTLDLQVDISFEDVVLQVQLEEGAIATAYEPYNRELKQYTVDFAAEGLAGVFWDMDNTYTYDWNAGTLDAPMEGFFSLAPQEILPVSGINTIYCDRGTIEVEGYATLEALVAEQEARITALESALQNG